MAELWPNMYPLVSKKWTKQKSNPIIQTACQKEAYPENFINLGWPQAKWIHHLPTWLQGVDDILPFNFDLEFYWNWSFFNYEKIMSFKKWPQLSGAGRTRAGHHHGSHTPTSPEAILLGRMAHHTKQIRRECTKAQANIYDFMKNISTTGCLTLKCPKVNGSERCKDQ